MKSNLLIVVIIIIVLVIWYTMSSRSYYTEVDTNPILRRIHRKFIALNPKYGVIPIKSGDSAYTDSKSEITICTHDPDTKNPYKECILDYVSLHELTHMITADYGHGEKFWSNFKTVLRSAVKKGLYDPNCKIPSKYCDIDDN